MAGFIDSQFLDIIEYSKDNPKILLWKFRRNNDKNDIMQGSKIIVRENQLAFFLFKGRLCDVIEPGTTTLTSGNLPILSSLRAFPFRLSSPMSCEVYFLKTNQFYGNKWATKTAVIKKDKDVGFVRVRGFGNFSFKVHDPIKFMNEIFINESLTFTYDIVEFLKSIVSEAFSVAVSAAEIPAFSLQSSTLQLSDILEQIVNQRVKEYGIIFPKIVIEGISFPNEVETLIDEQTGIGLAKSDMDSFIKYNSARAMRDAAKTPFNLSGTDYKQTLNHSVENNNEKKYKLPVLDDDLPIYAEVSRVKKDKEELLNNTVNEIFESKKELPVNNLSKIENSNKSNAKTKNDALLLIKNLLDQGILSKEEFDIEKDKILKSDLPWL